MISLQTGEAVSVPLAIANTDDSSVRDIRIHTSGLHKRTITPEWDKHAAAKNELETESLWFIAPFPDPKPFLAFWSQSAPTKKGGLVFCYLLGWKKKKKQLNWKKISLKKKKKKMKFWVLTKNYVETHTRLKAKQEPIFNLKKMLALLGKNVSLSDWVLIYRVQTKTVLNSFWHMHAAFLGGKGDLYAACDKGSHPSSIDQSPP